METYWPHAYSRKFRDHQERQGFLLPELRRGMGLGWGVDYQPWVTVTQLRGTKLKPYTPHINGHRIPRIHHIFSRHEASFFYLAERWPWVVDIREQWPILDFARTTELHFERGIPIPQRRKNGRMQYQLTTIDFLLTENTANGLRCRAVAVKPPDLAAQPKTERYLDVQRVWCEENGIPFTTEMNTGSVTLHGTLVEMRKWMRQMHTPDHQAADRFAERFLADHRRNVILSKLLLPLAKAMRIEEHEAMTWFRYCAWSNRIRVNLEKPLGANESVVLAPS